VTCVSFEGEVDVSLVLPAGTFPLRMKIKGARTRTDAPSLGLVMITDTVAKKGWKVDAAKRTYTESDLGATAQRGATPKFVKTERTTTVAGMLCEVWETTGVEVCLAPGLDVPALGLTGSLVGNDAAWEELLAHGFPVRIEIPDGKMKLEVGRIEQASVPDSDLAIPAGFRKTT
jgi:hypothetical protein